MQRWNAIVPSAADWVRCAGLCRAVRFTTPENNLSTYQFGKHKIKHHFCSTCGCAPLGGGTHNGIEMASINVRCLEGVELSALKIKQVDGRSF